MPCRVAAQNNLLRELDTKAASAIAKDNHDSATVISERLLVLANAAKNKYYVARAHLLKGIACKSRGMDKEAINDLYRVLRLAEKDTFLYLKAEALQCLGSINLNKTNYDMAAAFYSNELAIRKHLHDSLNVIYSLINLSQVQLRLKHYDSALYSLKQTLKYTTPRKKNAVNPYYASAMGNYFFDEYNRSQNAKLLDSCVRYYNLALDNPVKVNDHEMLGLFTNISSVFYFRNDLKKALEYLLRAEKRLDRLKREEHIILYNNLANIYYELKNYQIAADYLWKLSDFKDTLQQEKIATYSLELDKQFKVEKETYKNKVVQEQQKEIEAKTLEVETQSRRLYLSIFVVVVFALSIAFIILYYLLNKRLQHHIEEAKKKFFVNVVHEIRTPLSMIQAPLRLLKDKLQPDDKQHIELAERSITRLNDLVTQMLDISKIDTSIYRINTTYGNIELFFNDLLARYAALATQKQLEFIPGLQIGSLYGLFDKDALEKICGNLLDNAIKYTPAGRQMGINITAEESEQNCELTIQVWDTGPGIRENEQVKVFERFYRTGQVASVKGMGIGLTLVKELVQLMQGNVRLLSNSGGSTFTVKLPLQLSTAAENEPVSANTTTPLIATQFCILLVEDDRDILEFNAKLLAAENYRIIKATSATDALGMIEKTLPDLILCDLMMQGMDGMQFLKQIKSNIETDHIPVIILSARTASQTRIEVLDAGAQGYIAKPFLPEELTSLIRSQLDLLLRRKTEFREKIEQKQQTLEERFGGTDPYTKKLFALVFSNLDNSDLSVEMLADKMATNRSHFQRKTKALTGLSPSEIIKTIRLEKAKELLLTGKYNVTDVAYQTGYTSQSYFTRSFTNYFGYPPSKLTKG